MNKTPETSCFRLNALFASGTKIRKKRHVIVARFNTKLAEHVGDLTAPTATFNTAACVEHRTALLTTPEKFPTSRSVVAHRSATSTSQFVDVKAYEAHRL